MEENKDEAEEEEMEEEEVQNSNSSFCRIASFAESLHMTLKEK